MKKNYSKKLWKITSWLLPLVLLIAPLTIEAQTTIDCQTFESDMDGWDNDNGSRDTSSEITDTGSLKIEDEDEGESDEYDFSPYDYVTLTFTFKTDNFDSGKDVIVEFRDDGDWEEVAKYDEGEEFDNDISETVSVTVKASEFDFTDGTNDKFRILNDENSSDEDLYVDDVCITGYTYSTTSTSLDCQTFESDMDGWDNDNGSRDTSSEITDTGSVKIEDEDEMESDNFDFSSYDYVTLTFTMKTDNFDNGKDVAVEFRDDGDWEEVAKYDEGEEFDNDVSVTKTVIVRSSEFNFSDGTNDRFRILNKENSSDEDLYVDDVCITGYVYSTTNSSIACQTFEANIDGWDNDDGTRDTGSEITDTGTFELDKNDDGESDEYNFTGYDYVELAFTFKTDGFDSGDDFKVEFDDGDGGWEEVLQYVENTDFDDGVATTVTVRVYHGADFDFEDGTNDKFKIENKAGSNGELLYVDDVCITGYSYSTGPTPNATVLGNSVIIVDGDSSPTTTDHTDFGTVDVNSGTVIRTFSITNDGTADLTIGAITIGGTDAADFSVTAVLSPASPITAAATSTFSVTFDPSTLGEKSATISIVTDSPGENPYNFSISGDGTDPNVTEIDCQDFQTNIDGWDNDDGSRTSDNISGSSHSLELDINENAESDLYDFSDYGYVTMTYTFESETFETDDGGGDGDNYIVQFNDGSGWTELVNVFHGYGFVNGVDQTITVTVNSSDYDFTDGTNDRFRIMNAADGTDFLHLDDICITGYAYCYEDIVCTGTATVWNGSAWSTGVPNANKAATLQGDYDTGDDGDFSSCTLTIDNTYTLTIDDGGLVEVQSDIVNNGAIAVENNGSLVQYYDSASNSGTGTMSIVRQSQDMLKFDYTYWASPVSGYDMSGIDQEKAYTYTSGAWVVASGNMTPGKGYILMTDNTSNTVATKTTATFAGTLTNGAVNYTVDDSDSSWDLLGNPYPSAMDADDFIVNSTNEGLINGTVYLWNHRTRIDDFENGGGDFTSDDYASYNLSGGTAANSGGAVPTGKIASGQAFFVETTGAGSVVFNNCMRSVTAAGNDQFFKNKQVPDVVANRFWIDLINKDGASKQILIAYSNGATNGFDRLYDGKVLEGDNSVSFYSYMSGDNPERLSIQGRGIPSNDQELLSVGYELDENAATTNTIRLSNFEGVFVEETVYLVDKLLGVTHNLKESDYTFESTAGAHNDRFELKFKNAMKATINIEEEPVIVASGDLVLLSDGGDILLSSNAKNVAAVSVYNALGKLMYTLSRVSEEDLTISSVLPTKSIYIVIVTYEDGSVESSKIIH